MIKDVLNGIGGVGNYGVISVAIFFTFFVGMLVWACRLKKPHLDSMARLPLEDGTRSISASCPETHSDHRHE